MNKKKLSTLLWGNKSPYLTLSAFALAGFLSACGGSSSSSNETEEEVEETEETETTYEFTDCSSLTDQTELMTCLAGNVLSTLSDSDIELMVVDLTEENATENWSNLPLTTVDRNGISLDDMSDETQEAAETLLDSVLTMQGLETMDSLRAADEQLSTLEDAPIYGEDFYAVGFLGEPSTTDPWMIEFSGHHYTFFASFEGSAVSITPNFVATEPTSFTLDGVDFEPMARHQDAFTAMFDSLSDDELSLAEFPDEYDDVLVGPQQEGEYPDESEGLLVSMLDDEQRALVAAAIEAYSGDAEDTGQTEAYTTEEALDATYIGWATDSDLLEQGGYARIDGPNVWIEFTVQGGVVLDDPHYHSIWRDRELDYGGNFDL